jgi:hypothetical protein
VESEHEEDEEYVPGEDEDAESEDEDAESEDEDAEETESTSTDDNRPSVSPAILTLYHLAGRMDEIYIQSLIDHTFSVTTYYGCWAHGDKDVRSDTFQATGEEVVDHVNLLMKLTAIDCKPYKEVEFSVPFYPTVSMTPAALKSKSRRTILNRMMSEYAGYYME